MLPRLLSERQISGMLHQIGPHHDPNTEQLLLENASQANLVRESDQGGKRVVSRPCSGVTALGADELSLL